MTKTRLNDLFNAVKSTAANKEDIRRIDLNEILMRMLASSLRRNGSRRALKDFEKCLLYAFPRDITRDRGILCLAGNLVNLIDVDDAALCFLHVVICCLDEL